MDLVVHDGTVVVRGDLDMTCVAGLERTLVDLQERETPIHLDLSGVEYLDSSGLRCLLAATRRARRGERVTLLRPSTAVVRLLEITGTGAQFDIVSEG